MVDRASLNHYSTASSKAVDLAKRDLQRFWRRLDLTNPDKARDALLEFIPTLVGTYGDLVATAAMEWYDEERAKVKGLPPYEATSDVYPTIDAQATASTRYATGHLYTNNPHQALAVLEGTVHRLIKDAGRDVIARNVKLDPAHPRYARVPRGAKTCAWCSILASRGWVYVSKESANLHGKGHDHCDCELVPSWKSSEAYMEGYDPDALYAQYGESRRAVAAEGGDPNDLNAIAAKARQLYPGAYTDGAGIERHGVRVVPVKEKSDPSPVGPQHVERKKKFVTDKTPSRSARRQIINELKSKKVRAVQVARHSQPLSESAIIDRLSGGDMTEGSCSSLALAYAGNKAGFDVLDFRGGASADIFSTRETIHKLFEDPTVEAFSLRKRNEVDSAESLLEIVESGREYYLGAGRHAAIVRRQSNGALEYLEMQSRHPTLNGWTRLDREALVDRFSCEEDPEHACEAMLADVESLGQSKGFAEVLSYLNTQRSLQRKGIEGDRR